MRGELDGKVTLVTGASRGIGAGIALALSKEGASVVVNYRKNADKAEAVVKAITDEGGVAASFKADVANVEDVKNLCAFAEREFGGVDILVNNAGVHQHVPAHELPVEDWSWVLETNMTGPFVLSKACMPHMKENGWGRIINVSSMDAFTGTRVECHYGASKAGLIGFTKALALEVASLGITVNAVAPGPIETDMLNVDTEERRRKLLSMVPVGRLGLPEDIAHAVLFLASPKASFITGQTIHVNGGAALY
jgi:3-oxoacyl-[acyl-carrier protein] reductase